MSYMEVRARVKKPLYKAFKMACCESDLTLAEGVHEALQLFLQREHQALIKKAKEEV